MDYPEAVIEKAQKIERLLQRVDAGEPLEQICAELDVEIDEKRLAALQAKYKAGGETWEALLDGRFGHPHTAHAELRAWLYERKAQDETLRAPELATEIERKFHVVLSSGHINRLRRAAQAWAHRATGASIQEPSQRTGRGTSIDKHRVTGQRRDFFPWKQPRKRWGFVRALRRVSQTAKRST